MESQSDLYTRLFLRPFHKRFAQSFWADYTLRGEETHNERILPDCLFDAIDNIAYIIVGDVWAGGKTETYLEKFGLHIVGVGCATGVNRLLVHRLPNRATFDFLRKHKHSQSLHILVRLTIGRRTINCVNDTCGSSHRGLDDLLVGIFLPLNVNRRVYCRCTEPEIRIVAWV